MTYSGSQPMLTPSAAGHGISYGTPNRRYCSFIDWLGAYGSMDEDKGVVGNVMCGLSGMDLGT